MTILPLIISLQLSLLSCLLLVGICTSQNNCTLGQSDYESQSNTQFNLNATLREGNDIFSYKPDSEYLVVLNLGNSKIHNFTIQAIVEDIGAIIGKFKLDTESKLSAKFFLFEECSSTEDTFKNSNLINDTLALENATVLAVWASPDYTPTNNVSFYFSIIAENGTSWNNTKGTSLSIPRTPSSSSSHMITFNTLLILIVLFVMSLFLILNI